MSNIDKYKQMAAKAKELGVDMTKTVAGGGAEPTPAGPCFLRFTDYIELGKQKGTFKGAPTVKPKFMVGFEVSGPKHPPKEFDGKKVPHKVWIEDNFSLNERARFVQLFNTMNYSKTATHILDLLGDGFKGEIIHRKYPKRGEPKDDATKWTGVAVELFNKETKAFTVAPPRREKVDDETGLPTGEFIALNIPPIVGDVRAFLWDLSDLDDWNKLYIEGEYEEVKDKEGKVIKPAQSKNVLQNKIKSAVNFVGSPIYDLIAQAGGNLDLPEAGEDMDEEDDAGDAPTTPAKPDPVATTGAASDDVLNGVV